jgi:hypothetical protein
MCPELPNRKKGTGSNKDSFQDSLIGKLVRLSRQSGEDSKVLIQTPSKSRRDAIYVVGVPFVVESRGCDRLTGGFAIFRLPAT